jgi:histidinol-phosphatase (PHP family)
MIKAGGFTILGHLDLIRKNNPDESRFSERTSFYRDAVMEVVDTLRGRGIVAEINTGGIARGKTSTPYPSDWILRELYARDIPICLNADAHAPEHLFEYYDVGLCAALDAGYTTQTVPVLRDFALEHDLAVKASTTSNALLAVINL